jgi:Uma2 family endonuclease
MRTLLDPTIPAVEAADVIYPESDGKPMGETGWHVRLMLTLLSLLEVYFQHRDDVYVGANMFLYYEEGNPRKNVSPDVFAVFGVESHRLCERRSWFTWREGKAPDFILEVTSRSTAKEDTGKKKLLYETLGVREYFLFDPLHDYLSPPLQGYRLVGGRYTAIPLEQGQMMSRLLGLLLRPADKQLLLYDQATGNRLLTAVEMASKLEDDAKARHTMEAQIAAMQAELDKLRGKNTP